MKPEHEVVRGYIFRLEETLQVSEHALHIAVSKARLTEDHPQSQNHSLLSSASARRIEYHVSEIAATATAFQILPISDILV